MVDLLILVVLWNLYLQINYSLIHELNKVYYYSLLHIVQKYGELNDDIQHMLENDDIVDDVLNYLMRHVCIFMYDELHPAELLLHDDITDDEQVEIMVDILHEDEVELQI